MKTIVLTLKEGYEQKTIIGYKRIELVPGHCVTVTVGTLTPNPLDVQQTFAFCDGELDTLLGDVMNEASTSIRDEDACYLITYENAQWL